MTAESHTATSPAPDPAAEVERARSDYLAVSRCAHLYASDEDYDQAERAAWERLEAALARAAAVTVTR
ncbi:MAG: hypothetical protein AB1416_05540 [Actinomycetota bacterium]